MTAKKQRIPAFQSNRSPAPQVKAGITRAVNQSRKTGDWWSLENIIPTTAHKNTNKSERIHSHRIRIHNPDFRIDGVGNNTGKVTIVIGLTRQITRTVNPNPQPYTQPLTITVDPHGVTHYQPINGITAPTDTTLTPQGHITKPTPPTNTQTKHTTKPTTQPQPAPSPIHVKRVGAESTYHAMSRNGAKSRRRGRPIRRGSLQDLAGGAV